MLMQQMGIITKLSARGLARYQAEADNPRAAQARFSYRVDEAPELQSYGARRLLENRHATQNSP